MDDVTGGCVATELSADVTAGRHISDAFLETRETGAWPGGAT